MRRLVLLALLVVGTACSTDASPPPTPSSSANAGQATSPPASPDPSPSPTPADEVLEFMGEGSPLEPGRYRYSPFEPSITFAVGEGWEGGHDHVEFFDVWHGDSLSVGFGRPDVVFDGGAAVDATGLSSREALRTMAEGDIDAGAIGPTRLGGRPAFEMPFSVDRPTLVFGGLTGELTIEPGWDVRVIGVDVDGALVLIFVQRRGAETGRVADEVLASIRFG